MSWDNEALIRRHFEAFNRGDLGAMGADFAPEFEYVTSGVITDAGSVYRGHEEYVRFVEQMFMTEFSDVRAEVGELTETPDRVLVTLTVTARGRASGAATSWTFSQLWTLRDGMITRGQGFEDRTEAFEALIRALAEAGFRALNDDDLDAFMVLMADDVQFTSMVAEAEGATFRGHEGIREWWDTVRGAFQDVRWELLDIRASEDRAVNHLRMSGTLAGARVSQTMWQAVTLRGGKVAGWANFRTEREALDAVGIEE